MQGPSGMGGTPATQEPGYTAPTVQPYAFSGLANLGSMLNTNSIPTAQPAPSMQTPPLDGNSDYANQMAAATFATMPSPFAQMPMATDQSSPMQQVLGGGPRRMSPGDAGGMNRQGGGMDRNRWGTPDEYDRMRRGMGGWPPAPTPGGGPLPPPTPSPVPAPVPDPGSSPPPAAPPTTPTFGDQTGDPARWAQYLQSGYYQGLDPNAQSALRATLGL